MTDNQLCITGSGKLGLLSNQPDLEMRDSQKLSNVDLTQVTVIDILLDGVNNKFIGTWDMENDDEFSTNEIPIEWGMIWNENDPPTLDGISTGGPVTTEYIDFVTFVQGELTGGTEQLFDEESMTPEHTWNPAEVFRLLQVSKALPNNASTLKISEITKQLRYAHDLGLNGRTTTEPQDGASRNASMSAGFVHGDHIYFENGLSLTTSVSLVDTHKSGDPDPFDGDAVLGDIARNLNTGTDVSSRETYQKTATFQLVFRLVDPTLLVQETQDATQAAQAAQLETAQQEVLHALATGNNTSYDAEYAKMEVMVTAAVLANGTNVAAEQAAFWQAAVTHLSGLANQFAWVPGTEALGLVAGFAFEEVNPDTLTGEILANPDDIDSFDDSTFQEIEGTVDPNSVDAGVTDGITLADGGVPGNASVDGTADASVSESVSGDGFVASGDSEPLTGAVDSGAEAVVGEPSSGDALQSGGMTNADANAADGTTVTGATSTVITGADGVQTDGAADGTTVTGATDVASGDLDYVLQVEDATLQEENEFVAGDASALDAAVEEATTAFPVAPAAGAAVPSAALPADNTSGAAPPAPAAPPAGNASGAAPGPMGGTE